MSRDEAHYPAHYPAFYEDAQGREAATIENDGATLRVTLRGVVYSGADFDLLEPEPEQLEAARSAFTLNHGVLCACSLTWEMPLTLLVGGHRGEGLLRARLHLGGPAANGGIDAERLALELETPRGVARSGGETGYFEDELAELTADLPRDVALVSCFSCGLSDYSPAGHGLFGDLACFRDTPEAYARVRSKHDLFDLWEQSAGLVQETHLCPMWRPRAPDTGYRG
ncbi:MAG: hypothetical protein H6745_22605 [Deltaproteobacteria bacterium]|nr:hypothetical protein [Deltaproteobacteria bacterium]